MKYRSHNRLVSIFTDKSLGRRTVFAGLLVLLASISAMVVGANAIFEQITPPDSSNLRTVADEPPITVQFFQPELFFPALTTVSQQETLFNEPLRVGVVPHHLLASDKIAAFFSAASMQNIQTVVLIGPNHAESGESSVITTNANWLTPFGSVQTNRNLTARVLELPFVSSNTAVSAAEHSVSGLLPFIKKYMPEADVVTLLVSRKTTVEQLRALAATLASPPAHTTNAQVAPTSSQVLVVASVDFSHGVSNTVANKQDFQTLALLQNQQYDALQTLMPTQIDSPGSLIFADIFARLQNSTEIRTYHWGTASDYTQKEFEDITSYFVLGWY